MPSRFDAAQLVLTCEHASNRIPDGYRRLGLTPGALNTHIAWDRGAREIARACARHLGCTLHEGTHSRLLVDLNRGAHNPAVIPRVAFGVSVPGNEGLSGAERTRRLGRYHEPYRAAVVRDIESIIAERGACLHLSIHTFTPVLAGVERNADLGVLYDPARRSERRVACAMAAAARAAGWRARRNYPYKGTSDGLTTHCRRRFATHAYLGLELEVNQNRLADAASIRRAGEWLSTLLERTLLERSPAPGR